SIRATAKNGADCSAPTRDVRTGATASRTFRVLWTLALSADERGTGTRRKFRKIREAAGAQLALQALGRHPDRRLSAGREAEEHESARAHDTGELVEERDHVAERHEVECAVLVREVGRIGGLEAQQLRELGRQLA